MLASATKDGSPMLKDVQQGIITLVAGNRIPSRCESVTSGTDVWQRLADEELLKAIHGPFQQLAQIPEHYYRVFVALRILSAAVCRQRQCMKLPWYTQVASQGHPHHAKIEHTCFKGLYPCFFRIQR